MTDSFSLSSVTNQVKFSDVSKKILCIYNEFILSNQNACNLSNKYHAYFSKHKHYKTDIW